MIIVLKCIHLNVHVTHMSHVHACMCICMVCYAYAHMCTCVTCICACAHMQNAYAHIKHAYVRMWIDSFFDSIRVKKESIHIFVFRFMSQKELIHRSKILDLNGDWIIPVPNESMIESIRKTWINNQSAPIPKKYNKNK